ncbi:ankyrin repeat-containing domain protein [Aspergillus stella-maris]|uniref:ankyrin repeat-containing domain protein n=1 Tax=Aspergillus stella-maris TaxID=1810926 RepID=UPI003CCD65F8
MSASHLNHDAYTVGWVATLGVELDAGRLLLDMEHADLPARPHDPNSYILGEMGVHNVVIVFPPRGQPGIVSATLIVTNMIRTFPKIRFVLLVGIGGGAPGVPNASNSYVDIRLGDVVVCCPDGNDGGIVHHDKGKFTDDGFQSMSHVSKPPGWLLAKVQKLQSDHNLGRGLMIDYIVDFQQRTRQKETLAIYQFPGRGRDKFFKSDCPHIGGENCSLCRQSGLHHRLDREKPTVHHGLIASGSQIMRSAQRRDELRAERNILCFETEAVGLMDNFPCLVIRGISDYADSHKDDRWQGYAAVTSAAYAKDLLRLVDKGNVEATSTVDTVTKIFAQTIAPIEESVLAMKMANDEGRSERIMSWLSPLEYGDEQAAYLDKLATDTGKWFLTSSEFQDLIYGSNVTVYCHGIPGSGKSSLVSLAIDYLYSIRQQNLSLGIAYIFFSFNRENGQTLYDLIASLAKQLARQYPSSPHVVEEFYQMHYKEKQRPSVQKMILLLKKLMSGFKVSIIVLDALNECKDTNGTLGKFMQSLFQLQEQNIGTATNIIATSRTNQNIKALFRKATSVVEIRAQDDDLTRYLDAGLNCVQPEKMDDYLREQARTKIVKASDGMFLVARLHINHILTLPTKGHIHDALDNLSHGFGELDDLYSAAIKRLESKGEPTRELARNILAWVIHVKRPLVTNELQHALAIELNTKALNRELIRKYFSNIGHLQSICEGLVEVDNRNIIRLAHHTTYEYFDRLPEAWLTAAKAHVAGRCMTYLSYDIFGTEDCQRQSDYAARLIDYPFYGYSSQYWGVHIQDATMEYDDSILRLLTNKNKLASCCHVMLSLHHPFDERVDDDNGLSTDLPAMHIAAWFGLNSTLRRLMQLGGDLNAKDVRGRTPLMWAVANSKLSTLEWLLSHEYVDINAPDFADTPPLYVAIYDGNENIVRLFVERDDINLDHRDEFQATPLHIACMQNQATVTQILLSSGKANINARDRDGWTPLFMSINNEDVDTIKVLLRVEGIALNYRDARGCAPLVWAATRDYSSVVDLLLKAEGLDVNFRSGENVTALFVAAVFGHASVVSSLLRARDIDINAGSGPSLTPLVAAIWQGHISVVNILLSSGKIDVNALDDSSRTPIMHAVESGQEPVIDFLLKEYDVDVNRQYWYNFGHTGNLGISLNQGASANHRTNVQGTTLLLEAIHGKQAAAATSLLHNHADPNLRSSEGVSPLTLATSTGNMELARILLKYGADPNLDPSPGLTPLVVAIISGNMQMTEYLLDNGADPNQCVISGLSPLILAILFEEEETALKLLSHDRVDVRSRNEENISTGVLALKKGLDSVFRKIYEELLFQD